VSDTELLEIAHTCHTCAYQEASSVHVQYISDEIERVSLPREPGVDFELEIRALCNRHYQPCGSAREFGKNHVTSEIDKLRDVSIVTMQG
jgi:hypothetical protein